MTLKSRQQGLRCPKSVEQKQKKLLIEPPKIDYNETVLKPSMKAIWYKVCICHKPLCFLQGGGVPRWAAEKGVGKAIVAPHIGLEKSE